MASITRNDFEIMASEIADGFIKRGESLESGILAKAKASMMNSDQIKRLVEMANTSAFLDMFKGTSGDDRMVEFKVADPKVVISKYYNGKAPDGSPASSISKTTVSVMDYSDDDSDSNFFDDIARKFGGAGCGCESDCDCSSCGDESSDGISDTIKLLDEKTASYNETNTNQYIDKFRKQDIAESLTTKLAFCEDDFSQAANDIASKFKGIYSRDKYAEFELSAIARHGNAALPVLQAVRSRLSMEKISRSLGDLEIQLISDRHIVTDTQDLKKLASAVQAAADHLVISEALRRINNV
jgi:hypothetical protein